MALLRHKLPNAAPYISRRWPKAEAAFSASALSDARYFDLAGRAWYDFSPSSALIRDGSGGIPCTAIRPFLGTGAGANVLRRFSRDIDTGVYLWVTTFAINPSTVTSTSQGPRCDLYDGGTVGNDIFFRIFSGGLIVRIGTLLLDVALVSLADLPRAKPITLSYLVSATSAEIWMNGARLYSGTPAQTWGTSTLVWQAHSTAGSGTEAVVDYQQAATWSGDVSTDMARRLSFGPQELFEPSQIWVPVASAGSSYSVSISESSAAADVQTAIAGWLTSISETVTATDTATRTIVAVVSTSESASATDTVTTGAAAYDVSVAEAASATDAVSAIAAMVASASESLAAADAFTVAGVFGRSVSESASATDATNWGGALYSVDLAETATLADAVSAALSALAASVEAGDATDTLTVLVSGGTASVAESAAAADALSTTAQLVAALTETGSATDLFSASASGDLLGELVEAAAATDAYVVAVVRGIAVLTVRPMQPRSSGLLRPANLSGRGR